MVYVYKFKGWAIKTGPCTATFNDFHDGWLENFPHFLTNDALSVCALEILQDSVKHFITPSVREQCVSKFLVLSIVKLAEMLYSLKNALSTGGPYRIPMHMIAVTTSRIL
jgi:hypothetical protein